eukprot:NODE_575_length_6553_cov_0.185156.p2 type:complete len:154 gc:universal NODE_575_length_6553_cov_0.185156:808-1269(+)
MTPELIITTVLLSLLGTFLITYLIKNFLKRNKRFSDNWSSSGWSGSNRMSRFSDLETARAIYANEITAEDYHPMDDVYVPRYGSKFSNGKAFKPISNLFRKQSSLSTLAVEQDAVSEDALKVLRENCMSTIDVVLRPELLRTNLNINISKNDI